MRETTLALVLLAAGCGQKDTDAAGTTDTDTDTDTDSDTDSDADTDADTDTDTDTDTTTTPPEVSLVGFVEAVAPTPPSTQTFVVAEFLDETGLASGTTTGTGVTSGECTFFAASTTSTTTTTSPSLPIIDAGDVTISIGGTDVPLTPSNGAFFALVDGWPAGQDLAAAATGGVFPAFDIDPVLTLPDALALDSEPPSIDSTAALDLTWPGSGSDFVVFDLANANGTVSCFFADDGAGTVDASLLGMLGAGQASADASLEVITIAEVDATSQLVGFGFGPESQWHATIH